MILFRLLFVYIILLLVNLSSGRKTLVSRAVHNIRQRAVRQTHNLARDLRIAFRGVLIPRASGDTQHVVYCRQGTQVPFITKGPGNVTSGGTSSFAATSTKSSSEPTPTTTPTSPWKLANSYVCYNRLLAFIPSIIFLPT